MTIMATSREQHYYSNTSTFGFVGVEVDAAGVFVDASDEVAPSPSVPSVPVSVASSPVSEGVSVATGLV